MRSAMRPLMRQRPAPAYEEIVTRRSEPNGIRRRLCFMGRWTMNDSAIRQGNNPYFVAIAAVIVGGIIGFFGSTYNTNYASQLANQASVQNAQSADLRAVDLEIEHLKTSEANNENGLSRIEGVESTTQTNVNSLVSQFGLLKSALDAQTEGFHALQKQVGDMDRWLRPDPSIGAHGR